MHLHILNTDVTIRVCLDITIQGQNLNGIDSFEQEDVGHGMEACVRHTHTHSPQHTIAHTFFIITYVFTCTRGFAIHIHTAYLLC